MRVYIDGIRLLDAWPSAVDAAGNTVTVSNTFRQVGGGWHEMAVEMYDESGPAWVRVWWERLPTPPQFQREP